MSTINDIGIPGVGTGILHPRQKNRWRITFANLGGGVDSQPLSMQAVTVTRPVISFDEVQLDRYVSRAFIAGKYTFEPITLSFEDDVSGTASRVIQEQLQKQQWLIGAEGQWMAAAGEGSLYKFVTYLDLLDGNDQVTEKWTVEGCWLQQVDYTDLDAAASDAVLITTTLRYDHARQDIGGYSQGEGVATGGPGA
jgi:hypothetical protein